ncbi:phage antirepressor N-terminal domain-containing protein [Ursidibacter sp. B-7004-1]
MSNQLSTQTISFYGSDLITLKVEDVIYTAVKPIVEAMGLDWGGQQQKLNKSGDKFGCRDISMPTNGGLQKMICMPLKKLNGWLFSINPEKVRADLKDRVIQYQEECFEALYNYWHFGKAERKTTVDERTGLRDAVNMLVSKKGLIYSEAYQMVHQRFNVNSIEDLTPEQLPQAVEYVQRFAIEPYVYESEVIIQDLKSSTACDLSEDELQDLVWCWYSLERCTETLRLLYQPLQLLGADLAPRVYSQGVEYHNIVQQTHKILKRLTQKFECDMLGNWRVLPKLRDFDPNKIVFNQIYG